MAILGTLIAPSLARAQGGFVGPGRYEITSVNSGKDLDLDRQDGTTVMQWSPKYKDNQQWDAHPADEGFWVLRNVMSGAALECTGPGNGARVRALPFTQSHAQQWRIVQARDGNALIVSRLGKALDITGASQEEGARAQTFDVNEGANQRFVFRKVVTDRNPPPPQNERRKEFDRERADAHSGVYDERDHIWKLQGDGVCFYRGPNFEGHALCVRLGEDMRRVPDDWLEVFRSVRFFGRVRGVDVFQDPGFQGRTVRIVRDEPDLERFRSDRGERFERQVRSFRIF